MTTNKNEEILNCNVYGKNLLSKNVLSKNYDVCLVLFSGNQVLNQKSLNCNDLGSHIEFVNITIDRLFNDPEAKVIMYTHCTNPNDYGMYFRAYWFFVYFLTGVETTCAFDLINIIQNGATALSNSCSIENNYTEFEQIFAQIKASKYIQSFSSLSKSIYQHDAKAFTWANSPVPASIV